MSLSSAVLGETDGVPVGHPSGPGPPRTVRPRVRTTSSHRFTRDLFSGALDRTGTQEPPPSLSGGDSRRDSVSHRQLGTVDEETTPGGRKERTNAKEVYGDADVLGARSSGSYWHKGGPPRRVQESRVPTPTHRLGRSDETSVDCGSPDHVEGGEPVVTVPSPHLLYRVPLVVARTLPGLRLVSPVLLPVVVALVAGH